MAVSTQHKEYTGMLNKWERVIAVCKGKDAVHAKGTEFLPKLSDQTSEEYDAYRARAGFFNATWRTIVGLQGMLFRKPPQVEVPSLVEPMLENIDMAGTSLHFLALQGAQECLKLGRVGLFVDYPTIDTSNMTAADVKAVNARPSMRLVSALGIINWKHLTINNKTVLSMVVIKELKPVPVNEFEDEEQVQYRVLDLEQMKSGEYVYRVRVMKENEKGEDVLLEGPFYPMINSKRLDRIPFRFVGVDNTSSKVDEPPLIDLVDLNLAHYRVSADYEHGCHFTGLPTPVISGFMPEKDDQNNDQKFCIGSLTAWVFPRPDAKATYLEFTGAGLSALRDNLNEKKTEMALIGARMLEAQTKTAESANTAAIHRGGEQSMLASVADAISISFTSALEEFCEFANAEGEVMFQLNKDFFPIPMDALTLTAIIAGWQNGAYSYETMLANLKKGEIVAMDQTADDELADIAKNPPPVIGAGEGEPTNPGDVEKKSPKAKATPATPAPTQKQLQRKGGQN